MKLNKKLIISAFLLISITSIALAGCSSPPTPPPQGTGVGSISKNNVCAKQQLSLKTSSTSCSAQFTITAVNPSDKNSGNQRSVTSGFSTIVANP